MRHIIPPNPIKKAFEKPKKRRWFFGKGRGRGQARRAMLMKDHYASRTLPSVPRKLKLAVLLIGIILVIQSIFQIPLFRIKEVSIIGLKYLPQTSVDQFISQELSKRRWIFFKNDNYFLHADRVLKKQLEEKFYVEIVKYEKDFPNGLKLEIEERISGFVLQLPDQYILIDTLGRWVGETSGPQGEQTIIADERAVVGAEISLDYLERATIITESWDDFILPISLDKFHLVDDQNIIEVSTDKNFRIYFSPEKNLDQQLNRLAIFLQETDINEPREYIDLRFDESLYIR
jgi:hypothetical protein